MPALLTQLVRFCFFYLFSTPCISAGLWTKHRAGGHGKTGNGWSHFTSFRILTRWAYGTVCVCVCVCVRACVCVYVWYSWDWGTEQEGNFLHSLSQAFLRTKGLGRHIDYKVEPEWWGDCVHLCVCVGVCVGGGGGAHTLTPTHTRVHTQMYTFDTRISSSHGFAKSDSTPLPHGRLLSQIPLYSQIACQKDEIRK